MSKVKEYLKMELDLPTFKKIEAVGWTVAACLFFMFYGNLFAFIAVCVLVRKVYIRFKKSKVPMLDPEGKVVVVTGCDSGFGLGLAKRLHEKGFTVFAACLNTESAGGKELKALAAEKLRVVPLDVTNDDSVSKLHRVVKEQCENKGLWGLVNNAGLNFVGDVELSTMEQYLTIGNINMYGMVRTCKAFLPLLRQAKGRIVNVTSVKGLFAIPSNAPYTMAKFGAEAFSETLRLEMSQFGVKVSIIEPCNYGGATGCLNEAALKRIKADLDSQWNEAGPDVKEFYGPAHLTQQLDGCQKAAATSAPSIDPVLDAFEDALVNPCPSVRYLISGSKSFFDFYYVLALIQPYLPQHMFDKVRAYFVPYIVFK
ncbi:D-beta-hydroxybutyrate dehydrogenase, mitochondrial-like [Physella acuta]|uniref:D-beta-hydroxybutyrate dehydrogenase, mitochondrial-like n=1 Tax=Physella acuta TaxID=109671 RepID=UPI0027DC644D|nr:D-beta-hydroxybutyrate dehydrogenase, mitochondrial-like [Physella acuta]XP_059145804.1 D-beta-hydroxybutyrate dehydrogenase, mitochondrial-like [Physella acuta]XP_059145805.1 D-beta-hydroxybutyrate dehydrogenase, mitochondrial-like [Physella acuta]